jgi:hypothetical protein
MGAACPRGFSRPLARCALVLSCANCGRPRGCHPARRPRCWSTPAQMSQIEAGNAGVSGERVRRLAAHYACMRHGVDRSPGGDGDGSYARLVGGVPGCTAARLPGPGGAGAPRHVHAGDRHRARARGCFRPRTTRERCSPTGFRSFPRASWNQGGAPHASQGGPHREMVRSLRGGGPRVRVAYAGCRPPWWPGSTRRNAGAVGATERHRARDSVRRGRLRRSEHGTDLRGGRCRRWTPCSGTPRTARCSWMPLPNSSPCERSSVGWRRHP